MALTLSLFSCVSPDVQKQLSVLTQKQDSLLSELASIKNHTTFMAKKLGWEPPEDTMPKEIPLGNSFYQGAQNPILTIVEFSDFQCPYCARLAPILDSLVKSYPNKIRVVFKHFPLSFHKKADGAHAASIAAGKQGRFFDFRYKLAPLFGSLSDSTYLAVAQSIGLDMDTFREEMKISEQSKAIVQADIQLGRNVGVRGTPTLFANGKKVKDRSFSGMVRLLKSYEK